MSWRRAVGHVGGDRCDPTYERHARRPLPQHPTAYCVVHHRDEKQRITLDPLVQELGQLRRPGLPSKPLVQIRCHPCRGPIVEAQFLILPVESELQYQKT
jgi:hypothetical protein